MHDQESMETIAYLQNVEPNHRIQFVDPQTRSFILLRQRLIHTTGQIKPPWIFMRLIDDPNVNEDVEHRPTYIIDKQTDIFIGGLEQLRNHIKRLTRASSFDEELF